MVNKTTVMIRSGIVPYRQSTPTCSFPGGDSPGAQKRMEIGSAQRGSESGVFLYTRMEKVARASPQTFGSGLVVRQPLFGALPFNLSG